MRLLLHYNTNSKQENSLYVFFLCRIKYIFYICWLALSLRKLFDIRYPISRVSYFAPEHTAGIAKEMQIAIVQRKRRTTLHCSLCWWWCTPHWILLWLHFKVAHKVQTRNLTIAIWYKCICPLKAGAHIRVAHSATFANKHFMQKY